LLLQSRLTLRNKNNAGYRKVKMDAKVRWEFCYAPGGGEEAGGWGWKRLLGESVIAQSGEPFLFFSACHADAKRNGFAGPIDFDSLGDQGGGAPPGGRKPLVRVTIGC
jgi:hypothetical protein